MVKQVKTKRELPKWHEGEENVQKQSTQYQEQLPLKHPHGNKKIPDEQSPREHPHTITTVVDGDAKKKVKRKRK